MHIASNQTKDKIRSFESWLPSKSKSYNNYKYIAEDYGINFELTKPEFKEIIKNPCYFCNTKNSINHQNGIIMKYDFDRFLFGYDNDNCVSCCYECEKMQSEISYEQFIYYCTKITYNIIDKDTYVKLPFYIKRCYIA